LIPNEGVRRRIEVLNVDRLAYAVVRASREEAPRYRHVLVDDAQDLHPSQWRLLRAARCSWRARGRGITSPCPGPGN